MGFDFKKAAEELAKKSLDEIQLATAYTWASRACVAYESYLGESGDLKWYLDAKEYEHEALEHAALIKRGNAQDYLEIHDKLDRLAEKANKKFDSIFMGLGPELS
jgi:hypothetical protein